MCILKMMQMQMKNKVNYTPEQIEIYKNVGGTPFLDGEYTVFGEVIEGLDVIDAIATTATDRYDRPYDDVIITAIVPFDESETEEETTAPADTTKVE